ncbi:MAG TPA: hypothetical protein VN374_00810 [Desulfitobacteriaceae bacterium]|nr:hypothetical protein [Desulfitobacteriaceae bacterium]
MSRRFFKSKYWLGSGRLNHKRYADMSEEELAYIVECPGEIDGRPCRKHTFRCTVCGNYGCVQDVPNICTEQGFEKEKCLICGVANSRIPILG